MGAEIRDAKERQKEREREQKKRGTRKYGQAKQKHSRMGIYSCVFAFFSLSLIAACIVYAFVMRGNIAGVLGGLGIIAMLLAAYGIRVAAKGMREREKNYITCKAGMALNVLILLGLITIFIGGLR